jgi:hypothetical protein
VRRCSPCSTRPIGGRRRAARKARNAGLKTTFVRGRFVAGVPRADNRCECSGRTQSAPVASGGWAEQGRGLYDGAVQPYSGKDTGVKGIPVFVSAGVVEAQRRLADN